MRCSAELTTTVGLCQQSRDGSSEIGGVLGIDQPSRVPQYFGNPTTIGANHGRRARHCLRIDQPEWLLEQGRAHENGCSLKPRRQIPIVVNVARKLNFPIAVPNDGIRQLMHLADVSGFLMSAEAGGSPDYQSRVRMSLQDSG